MCGVVGVFAKQANLENFRLVKKVILESAIRGLHATGVSFLPHWSNKPQTIIEPKPAKYFIEMHMQDRNFPDFLTDDGDLCMIAHCRYSTSDLQYNQPLYNENFSIVHNGVISQEMPENWEKLYGYKCSTRNDSELILHTLEAGKSPLIEFANSSMAVVELHKSKKIRFYRNGKRPIYYTSIPNGVIITSTKDIAFRAGLNNSSKVDINEYKVYDGNMQHEKINVPRSIDLQK